MPVRLLASLVVALGMWAPTHGPLTAQSAQLPPSQTATPAAPPAAARVKLTGLPYFGAVSAQLYRGAQPENSGFAELKKMGIDIVVNFRHEPDEIARERTIVEGQGMRYVSIPWRGKEDPKTEQVAEFLDLLRSNPNKKVFVHCQRGAERTGVMVACYRISRDNWTPERALDEMEEFRFRGLRFGHLKKFVRDFPSLLLSDPLLKTIGS